jgi:hypothetical protein
MWKENMVFLKLHLGITLENIRYYSQNKWTPSRNSNWKLPELKTRGLPLSNMFVLFSISIK